MTARIKTNRKKPMPLPAIDSFQRATYPSIRDVVAVIDRPEPEFARSSRPLGPQIGQAILALMASVEEPQTTADIARRIGVEPGRVGDWIKQNGARARIVSTGSVKRRPGIRAERLYAIAT